MTFRHLRAFVTALAAVFVFGGVTTFAQTQLVTGKPAVFKVTVTKVELGMAGDVYRTVFTGSAQMDLVAANGLTAFPGIENVTLPTGTYTSARVTFLNSFGVSGSLIYDGTTYYTTATTTNGNQSVRATTVVGELAEATLRNPAWGALGVEVQESFTFPSSVIVVTGQNFAPTLKFDVTNSLVLCSQDTEFCFRLAPAIVTLIMPATAAPARRD